MLSMSKNWSDQHQARASKPLAICVFCDVESGADAATQRLAGELGAHIAGRGHLLVYGAGGSGLMGAVARGVSRAGGSIMGVLPAFLNEREHTAGAPAQTLMLTKDLTDRKLRMMSSADAFIGLPGGYGTLDGIVEVAARAQHGLHDKPLVLLDSGGLWEQFRDLISGIRQRGFAVGDTSLFALAYTAQEAVEMVEDKAAA
ncbi:TIGR00730 family Rossman fold protein (plasmid) [Streptomyces cynarae]|uniref:Cytokinin riboside 5'-monophosphate phosphoribohydrolase n=1 Tax=Streptomyces cynarae TaxID=2981134 RepID=A0ABY6EG72_9ACTN|nr:TIGR00730 family Rossman fold protein [Streptomyces cynarae]UXY24908.1 TIGR00730 family Rossman fold protein [Streptomyces cynarae]